MTNKNSIKINIVNDEYCISKTIYKSQYKSEYKSVENLFLEQKELVEIYRQIYCLLSSNKKFIFADKFRKYDLYQKVFKCMSITSGIIATICVIGIFIDLSTLIAMAFIGKDFMNFNMDAIFIYICISVCLGVVIAFIEDIIL